MTFSPSWKPGTGERASTVSPLVPIAGLPLQVGYGHDDDFGNCGFVDQGIGEAMKATITKWVFERMPCLGIVRNQLGDVAGLPAGMRAPGKG